jgi:ribosomal protein L9
MRNVKLLLNETIKNVGKVGDVVEVSRPAMLSNYLLPKGLAVEPTPGNMKKIEARRKEIERQERERREQQEALIKQLDGRGGHAGTQGERAGASVRVGERDRHCQGDCRGRGSISIRMM